jgi:hypothetical protein
MKSWTSAGIDIGLGCVPLEDLVYVHMCERLHLYYVSEKKITVGKTVVSRSQLVVPILETTCNTQES